MTGVFDSQQSKQKALAATSWLGRYFNDVKDIVSMPAQIFVCSLPQVEALPVGQQFHSIAPEPQSGIINPSRSITTEDEVYLRNYALAAFVLSWDECTYSTPE